MIISPLFFIVVLVRIDQIKAKLGVAYKNAVKNYNSTDSVSSAVDVIQRTVSGRISITLMAPALSASVCVTLQNCLHKASLERGASRSSAATVLLGFPGVHILRTVFFFFPPDR